MDKFLIQTAFASGSTGFINDIVIGNFVQLHFIEEVDTDKPIAPLATCTILIFSN